MSKLRTPIRAIGVIRGQSFIALGSSFAVLSLVRTKGAGNGFLTNLQGVRVLAEALSRKEEECF